MAHRELTRALASWRSGRPTTLLIVEGEPSTKDLCAAVAASAGVKVIETSTAEEARFALETQTIDILLVDLALPDMSGVDLLKRVTELHPSIFVIVLTQYGAVDAAAEPGQARGCTYVMKPVHIEPLRREIARAVEAVEQLARSAPAGEHGRRPPGCGQLIGSSEKMERIYATIERIAPQPYSVLILGESGTGKELVARAIHLSSPRRERPFVPVDCSAITPTLIESELFGYVRGAFTGAMQSKQGLLEAANGGTLFLDEIGEMPVEMQAKLLRAIQEREVKPVGATERRPIDVRIIAATHRDLEAGVKQGSFRQDLYFRLNVIAINLPALRERKGDIPCLAAAFLERYTPDPGPVYCLSDESMRRLMAYDWPGNVRELENAIARAVACGSGPVIHVGDLPRTLYAPPAASGTMGAEDELLPLDELERRAILRALHDTHGDKVAASKILGIGKTTLYRKLKEYQFAEAENG